MRDNKWISILKPRSDAKLRLFCFPYAGSGASIFYKWPDSFSTEVEICAIKLPGREKRFNEKPYTRIEKALSPWVGQNNLPVFI